MQIIVSIETQGSKAAIIGSFRRAESNRAVEFVAGYLADGRAAASSDVVLRVLRHLALGPWAPGGEPPRRDREDRFMAVLKQAASEGGVSHGGPPGWDLTQVRGLAREAGFARAEAHALHLAGDYAGALDCLLKWQPSATAAFDYVESMLGDPAEVSTPHLVHSVVYHGSLYDLGFHNHLPGSSDVFKCCHRMYSYQLSHSETLPQWES
jgi:hypothetical protein